VQRRIPLEEAAFQFTFNLDASPSRALVNVCAFKNFDVMVNGQPAQNIIHTGENWKSPSTLDITKSLHGGTNEIVVLVKNSQGPPALWLQFHAGLVSFGTDKNWLVSQAASPWQNAVAATQPPAMTPGTFYVQETMFASMTKAWPLLLLFCAVSVISVFAVDSWLRKYPNADSTKLVYAFLVLVIIARIALFINDVPQLSNLAGFDVVPHEQYVQFIQEKHALPSAADGWEMYQPPLYYICGAGLLNAVGLSTHDRAAAFVLRSINGLAGLIQCVLSLLCLRLLFPQNAGAQAAGLLIASFIPPQLFLSDYVTNELLSGLFATAAFYFLLQIIRKENENFLLYFGLGAALGAALLTKSSSLLLLPPILLALWLRFLWYRRPFHDWLWFTGIFLVSCMMICGFFYGKNWWQYGELMKGNWASFSQYPGFRTYAWYCRFGRVFVAPLFGGLWSFGDGFYSTLWGDGLVGGASSLATRPPWNYSLMDSGFACSAMISIIFFIGFAIAMFRFVQERGIEWIIMPAILVLFGFAILFMTLRVPAYAQAKAFYGLPAFFPFIAVTVAGWDWLSRKNPVLRKVLWVMLLVWTTTVFGSFWIRSGNPQTYLDRGIAQFDRQNYDESARCFSMAARLIEIPDRSSDDPAFALMDGVARLYLGQLCGQDGNVVGAISNYQKALQIAPRYAEAYNNLGNALLQKGSVNEAIAQFRLALQINPDFEEACYNLGNALLQKGDTDGAIACFRQALQINPGDAGTLNNLGNALLQKGDVDGAIAQFRLALQMDPDFAEVCYNLGNALLQKGSVDEAIACFQKALQIKSDFAEACYGLGNAWLQKGNLDKSIAYYQQALEINPDYAKAQNKLGNALYQQGKVNEAISCFQKALQINPDYMQTLNNLAWILATCSQASLRNGNEAVKLAQRADQLADDSNPSILATLAAAYAEAGRFPEAMEAAHRALQIAEAQPNNGLADVIRSQLKLYQTGTPFHYTQHDDP